MNAFKRFWLMVGGSQLFHADQNFNEGRFWPWVFNLTAVAVLIYLSKPHEPPPSTPGKCRSRGPAGAGEDDAGGPGDARRRTGRR